MKPNWQRVIEIFEEASELPPDRREAWLDTACDGDRTLYSDVQSLLQAHEHEGGFLEQEIATYATQVADSATPTRIGSYHVLSEIARGGMGAVYLAERDDRQYESKVTIKLVHSGSASHADLKRRVLTERQILASLRHPYIAQMLDGGITDDGIPYLVMEYVEGLRIDEYCRRNATPLRQRIELFRMVCSAVQSAHRNLVVHRDLKPSNILVDADGAPKLLDFGIAKLLRPADMPHTVAMTQPAQRLMTLEYASPEQFRGEEVTTATDVYALGIVLYELLAECHPFERQRSDFLALQHAVCETEPAPPSSAASPDRTITGELGSDLDNIVLKAIRKEPAERYDSVEKLSDDLDRYLSGYPVAASQGTRRYRMGKFVRRHRLGVLAAAAFMALLMAFSIGAALLAARVTRERNLAQEQRVRAEKVSAFLNSLFRSSDPFNNRGATLSAKDLLDEGAARISKELRAEPQVRADLLETIGQAYKHLGLFDKSEEIFRQKVEAVDQAYGPNSEEKGRILRQLGDSERQRGKLTAAEDHLRQSLAILERLPPDKDLQLSHALNNMGLLLQAKGDLAGAEIDMRRAVEISRKYPSEIAETLTMSSNLALLLRDRGKDEEAESLFRDTLAQRRRVLGESHPQVTTSMRQLATAMVDRGHGREAAALYREVLARYAKVLPPDHPEIVVTTALLAGTMRDEGDFAQAEKLYRDALASDARTIGEHGNTAAHCAALAFVLFLEGNSRDAEQLLQRGLQIVHADGNSGAIREARLLTQLSVVENATGRFDAATRSLAQALRIGEKYPNSSQPETAAALFQLAEAQKHMGRTTDADASYRKAIEIDRARGPAVQFALTGHLLGYAGFLAMNDGLAAAETMAREAVHIRTHVLARDSWQTYSANSVLAVVLAGQHRYDEAEPLAAVAYAELSRRLGAGARPVKAAEARLWAIRQAHGKPRRGGLLVANKDLRAVACCVY